MQRYKPWISAGLIAHNAVNDGEWVLYSDALARIESLEAALRECVRMMYMARESDDVMDDHNWSEYQRAIDSAKTALEKQP